MALLAAIPMVLAGAFFGFGNLGFMGRGRGLGHWGLGVRDR